MPLQGTRSAIISYKTPCYVRVVDPPPPQMRLQSITALVALAFSAQQAQAIEPGFPYGSRKVRGVNLGGWLVLEVR